MYIIPFCRGYSARVWYARVWSRTEQFSGRDNQAVVSDKILLSGMKHKHLYVGVVLAILGIAVLVVSMTMIHSEPKALLGIVLGGALVQAGIATFVGPVANFSRPVWELCAKAIRPNFWLLAGISDGRISTCDCANAGSAERNSLPNRARKNFATGPRRDQSERSAVSHDAAHDPWSPPKCWSPLSSAFSHGLLDFSTRRLASPLFSCGTVRSCAS